MLKTASLRTGNTIKSTSTDFLEINFSDLLALGPIKFNPNIDLQYKSLNPSALYPLCQTIVIEAPTTSILLSPKILNPEGQLVDNPDYISWLNDWLINYYKDSDTQTGKDRKIIPWSITMPDMKISPVPLNVMMSSRNQKADPIVVKSLNGSDIDTLKSTMVNASKITTTTLAEGETVTTEASAVTLYGSGGIIFILTDNSTEDGKWALIELGAQGADPSDWAGLGLTYLEDRKIGSNQPVITVPNSIAPYQQKKSDRGSLTILTGGVTEYRLLSPSQIDDGFSMTLLNLGSSTVDIVPHPDSILDRWNNIFFVNPVEEVDIPLFEVRPLRLSPQQSINIVATTSKIVGFDCANFWIYNIFPRITGLSGPGDNVTAGNVAEWETVGTLRDSGFAIQGESEQPNTINFTAKNHEILEAEVTVTGSTKKLRYKRTSTPILESLTLTKDSSSGQLIFSGKEAIVDPSTPATSLILKGSGLEQTDNVTLILPKALPGSTDIKSRYLTVKLNLDGTEGQLGFSAIDSVDIAPPLDLSSVDETTTIKATHTQNDLAVAGSAIYAENIVTNPGRVISSAITAICNVQTEESTGAGYAIRAIGSGSGAVVNISGTGDGESLRIDNNKGPGVSVSGPTTAPDSSLTINSAILSHSRHPRSISIEAHGFQPNTGGPGITRDARDPEAASIKAISYGNSPAALYATNIPFENKMGPVIFAEGSSIANQLQGEAPTIKAKGSNFGPVLDIDSTGHGVGVYIKGPALTFSPNVDDLGTQKPALKVESKSSTGTPGPAIQSIGFIESIGNVNILNHSLNIFNERNARVSFEKAASPISPAPISANSTYNLIFPDSVSDSQSGKLLGITNISDNKRDITLGFLPKADITSSTDLVNNNLVIASGSKEIKDAGFILPPPGTNANSGKVITVNAQGNYEVLPLPPSPDLANNVTTSGSLSNDNLIIGAGNKTIGNAGFSLPAPNVNADNLKKMLVVTQGSPNSISNQKYSLEAFNTANLTIEVPFVINKDDKNISDITDADRIEEAFSVINSFEDNEKEDELFSAGETSISGISRLGIGVNAASFGGPIAIFALSSKSNQDAGAIYVIPSISSANNPLRNAVYSVGNVKIKTGALIFEPDETNESGISLNRGLRTVLRGFSNPDVEKTVTFTLPETPPASTSDSKYLISDSSGNLSFGTAGSSNIINAGIQGGNLIVGSGSGPTSSITSAGFSIPTPLSGVNPGVLAGQVLTVNAARDGYELKTPTADGNVTPPLSLIANVANAPIITVQNTSQSLTNSGDMFIGTTNRHYGLKIVNTSPTAVSISILNTSDCEGEALTILNQGGGTNNQDCASISFSPGSENATGSTLFLNRGMGVTQGSVNGHALRVRSDSNSVAAAYISNDWPGTLAQESLLVEGGMKVRNGGINFSNNTTDNRGVYLKASNSSPIQSYTLTLPLARPSDSNAKFLVSDTEGNLSFSSAGAGAGDVINGGIQGGEVIIGLGTGATSSITTAGFTIPKPTALDVTNGRILAADTTGKYKLIDPSATGIILPLTLEGDKDSSILTVQNTGTTDARALTLLSSNSSSSSLISPSTLYVENNSANNSPGASSPTAIYANVGADQFGVAIRAISRLRSSSQGFGQVKTGTIHASNTGGTEVPVQGNAGGGPAIYADGFTRSPTSIDIDEPFLGSTQNIQTIGTGVFINRSTGGAALYVAGNISTSIFDPDPPRARVSYIAVFRGKETAESVDDNVGAIYAEGDSKEGETPTVFIKNKKASGPVLYASSGNGQIIDAVTVYTNGVSKASDFERINSLEFNDILSPATSIEEEALALFKEIPISKYKNKDDEDGLPTYGLIAEHLNEVMPQAVRMDPKIPSIKKDMVFELALPVIQNLIKRIEALESTILEMSRNG